MEQWFILMLGALFFLAIADLIVGVSNDAVNFLNSAIGSKAISMRTIMIIASVGVTVGAVFSSGLMEVARKGIFTPDQYNFTEIMIVFMAVMITDVLLLDFFNSLGLPTSTTVSIVFELLGAAVSIATIKILSAGNSISQLGAYINSDKATEIIAGILLSVLIAFTVGAIVQYISRLVFTFQYEKKIKYVGGIFGGIAMTSITYFILIKGLKSVSFISEDVLFWVKNNTLLLIAASLISWTLISQLIMNVFKQDVLKIIIIVGTFALALAFAGNDLVNFIGVPIAAWQSYDLWASSGQAADTYMMTGLSGKVQTPEFLLVLAGIIMVATLWFSSKARAVVDTGVNLSRQGEGIEKFKPNYLSRTIVRYSVLIGNIAEDILPKKFWDKVDSRFAKPPISAASKRIDPPAFDKVRASVNLVVASILISIGTNLKLPLSTTYVTFMVAMGASLADRAWDRESAVYRVAGVVNVVGGWFVTALVAFIAAATFAAIIFYGGIIAVGILVLIAVALIVRSAVVHTKKVKEEKSKKQFNKHEIVSINEITIESSENISDVIFRINAIYSNTMNSLGLQDLGALKKNKKLLKKLDTEIDDLKNNIFYFIKSLEDNAVGASNFYILTLDHLQDMVQSIGLIGRNSYEHVNNNHKGLKFNQIRELKRVDKQLETLFLGIKTTFDNHQFRNIDALLEEGKTVQDSVNDLVQKQIERIRTSETSPKNTKLYFGILLETKDLLASMIALLQQFQSFYREAQATTL